MKELMRLKLISIIDWSLRNWLRSKEEYLLLSIWLLVSIEWFNWILANEKPMSLPEGINVHDDIKREIAFYNSCREDVMKGMQFLI